MANFFMANGVKKIVKKDGTEAEIQMVYNPITKSALPLWLENGERLFKHFIGELSEMVWENKEKGTSGKQLFVFQGVELTPQQYNDLSNEAAKQLVIKEKQQFDMEMLKLQLQIAQLNAAANAPLAPVSHQPLAVGV